MGVAEGWLGIYVVAGVAALRILQQHGCWMAMADELECPIDGFSND